MKPLNLLYDTTSLRGIVIDPENEQCTDQFSFQVTFRIDISLVLKATLMNDIITRNCSSSRAILPQISPSYEMSWCIKHRKTKNIHNSSVNVCVIVLRTIMEYWWAGYFKVTNGVTSQLTSQNLVKQIKSSTF